MSDVKRWATVYPARLIEHPLGDYVSHYDHFNEVARLKAEVEELKKNYDDHR